MAKKNSGNFQLEKANGELLITTSAAQKTTNFQPIDNYAEGAIFNSTASATVANSIVETTLIGTGTGSLTLPVNFLAVAKAIEIEAWGTIASILTPTLRLRIKLGSVTVIDTTAVTLLTITGTNLWNTRAVIDCRTTGATGTVFGQGMGMYYTSATGLAGIASPNTTTSTVDTTATQVIDMTVLWGSASASNTITCTNFKVKVTM